MTTAKTVSEAVAERSAVPAKVSPKEALRSLIEDNKSAIGLSLPKGMDADRFARLLLTAANATPKLFECDRLSFLAAGVTCAQLGLEPNDPRGLAYLIPFKDRRKGMVVQTVIGYRGLLDLARRSRMVGAIHAFVVREGDDFTYELGLRPDLKHKPKPDNEDSPITHAYAVAEVHTGSGSDPQFFVVTRKQLDVIKKASLDKIPADSQKYSPWNTYEAEMACKTALRRLCKFLPLTVEAANAVEGDERPLTLTDVGVASYIDTTSDETDEKHPDAIETGTTEPTAEQQATPAAQQEQLVK